MTRDEAVAVFLARAGYGAARAAPLAQDASFRRYLRLTDGPRPAVLMDAPPPEDVRPFLTIAAHLSGIGVSAPEIIAADAEAGLVLEEDLGDALFPTLFPPADVLASWPDLSRPSTVHGAATDGRDKPGQDVAELFDAAIDALVVMHGAAPPPDLPAWDAATMRQTALATVFDWWWPATFHGPAPDAARADVGAALVNILTPLADGPPTFTHRDFFAGNLLWLPDRAGVRRVGVIDFQGAAISHPAYDLVSLLQDARRVIPAAIGTRGVARYLAARPELDSTAFTDAYAACAAQRHMRVAGQWVRLAQRDNRPGYLAYGPHTWALLEDALRQPAAAPLAAALDRWIPPAHRCNPPDLAA
jgi:aminoglycoside/choline kinase family phosphotransferase